MTRMRDDIVGVDASILMARRVWQASGHESAFTDPMVDCTNCKNRFRADQVEEMSGDPNVCPACGMRGTLTAPRQFNLMFKTYMGPVEEDAGLVYLRPETAQGTTSTSRTCRQACAGAAVRHRADRQVVPQRDQPRQLHLPHARVRADGDAVLHPARRRTTQWYEYWREQRWQMVSAGSA